MAHLGHASQGMLEKVEPKQLIGQRFATCSGSWTSKDRLKNLGVTKLMRLLDLMGSSNLLRSTAMLGSVGVSGFLAFPV